MARFIGLKRSTLPEFYAWQGADKVPGKGTVNDMLGLSMEHATTHRYTYPMIHKDSTVEMDENNMPRDGTIRGDETDVIYIIDNSCPVDVMPHDLLTNNEFMALDWLEKLEDLDEEEEEEKDD